MQALDIALISLISTVERGTDMRLIDADTLYCDSFSYHDRLCISQNQIAHATTVDAIPMSVIEDIKAEIKALAKEYDHYADTNRKYGLWTALDIIDKHISGKEHDGNSDKLGKGQK